MLVANVATLIMRAEQLHVQIANGADEDVAAGEPTRDPTAARRGALLPFGGYKGFGLALMMQALGLLAGSGSDAESE